MAVFAYLVIWRRPLLLRTGIGFGIPLLAMLVYFRIEYGQFLPYYYQTGRLRSWPRLQWLYGVLLSPGRGLWIYNPFLGVVLVGMALSLHRLVRQPLFWLALCWFGIHLFSVVRWGYWWAGWSFGSRILVDTLPALLLLTLLTWTEVRATLSPLARRLALALFLGLAPQIGLGFSTQRRASIIPGHGPGTPGIGRIKTQPIRTRPTCSIGATRSSLPALRRSIGATSSTG